MRKRYSPILFILLMLWGCSPYVPLAEACTQAEGRLTTEGYLLINDTSQRYCSEAGDQIYCWMALTDRGALLNVFLRPEDFRPVADALIPFPTDWIKSAACRGSISCSLGSQGTRFRVTGVCDGEFGLVITGFDAFQPLPADP